MRVTHPSVDEFLIEVLSLLDAFVPCLVILVCKEFFGTLGGSHQVNHSLISSVSQLHGAPPSFVKDGLPYVLISVSRAVHDSTIT